MPAKVKRSAARSRRTRATPAHDAPHTAAGNRPAESLHAGAKAVAAARERHEIGHAAAGRESLPHGPPLPRDGPARRRHPRRRPRHRGRAPAPPRTADGVHAHRPVARPAHHGRVRRRVRSARVGREGGDHLRLGTRGARRPAVPRRGGGRATPRPGGFRHHHRRRPRHHGGGEQGRDGGRRALHRLQHRAAVRAAAESVSRYADRLPLLLRAEDDVREIFGRLPHLPGWIRHARRALRGAGADPDGQALPLPRDPLRTALLERPRALAPGPRPPRGKDMSCGPRSHAVQTRTAVERSDRERARS